MTHNKRKGWRAIKVEYDGNVRHVSDPQSALTMSRRLSREYDNVIVTDNDGVVLIEWRKGRIV